MIRSKPEPRIARAIHRRDVIHHLSWCFDAAVTAVHAPGVSFAIASRVLPPALPVPALTRAPAPCPIPSISFPLMLRTVSTERESSAARVKAGRGSPPRHGLIA